MLRFPKKLVKMYRFISTFESISVSSMSSPCAEDEVCSDVEAVQTTSIDGKNIEVDLAIERIRENDKSLCVFFPNISE